MAALSAGAVDAGVDCLRRAATDAQRCGDARLQGRALFELGSALVHAVRGHDDEGAIVLRQSVELAKRCGDGSMTSAGYRELGYVDALAGRRPTAAAHPAEALRLAEGSDALAATHGIIGFNLVDWGRVDEGLAPYELSLEHARRTGNRRHQAWSLGLGGRGLLAASRPQDAQRWLQDCVALVDALRWASFRPWPCALLGESWLRLRIEPPAILQELERAFALSCQLADPCWEAAVARAVALSSRNRHLRRAEGRGARRSGEVQRETRQFLAGRRVRWQRVRTWMRASTATRRRHSRERGRQRRLHGRRKP